MKILAVIPAKEEGVSLIFCKKQIKSIASQGVSVVSFYLSTNTSLLSFFSEWKRLRKTIKDVKPDVLHCHYGSSFGFLCAMTCFNPLVITFQGSDLNRTSDMKFYKSFLVRLFSNLSVIFAKRIVCVSDRLKNRLWWGLKKAIVIPHGVNLDFFKIIPKNEARVHLKIGMDEKVILFSANNPLVKRLDIAEKVESILQSKIPHLRFIHFKGQVEEKDIPYYFNAADAFLLCSDTEGSPVVIKEALACNLPIVSNDVGDVVERIDGVFNCKVVSQDAKALSNALYDVIFNGNRTNGRERLIMDGLTEDLVGERLISLYEKC